ncbi:MAG: hypothetical protein E7365_02175 [Clostridiales bacterium]|nr:hypothetical protein [Clostridiales bacterium]
MEENTRRLLIDYCKRYPELQVQDIFKFLYQSAFGCEHLVASCEKVTERIFEEYTHSVFYEDDEIDKLDGNYVRVPLTYIDRGLSIKTLCKLFMLSAKKEVDGSENLENKLKIAGQLAEENLIPFSKEDFIKEKITWQKKGYPPVHHSENYRKAYNPSYRVISKEYARYLPIFLELDKMLKCGNVKIALEGGSASGKTTLSQMLENIYDCTVFHMDDFFLQMHQRTKARYKEIGGNIDWERFLQQVLVPLNNGQDITYEKFDCSTMCLGETITVKPKNLTVIEGAYSMHVELEKYYDFSVFLNVSDKIQKQRILKRNTPEMAQRFFNEWIPLEKMYFDNTDIKKRCKLIININE